VTQDKKKYNTPKYRLIVRFSNTDITCQVSYATIAGDKVLCSAYAHELPKFGLKVGLTNYAAAYSVGLLCARRCVTKIGLDTIYGGTLEATGEDTHVELDEGPHPLSVVLDAGLNRTSTGSKIFAVMKGALDGGLNIPHNEKRFVGYDGITKHYDPDIMKKYIFGGHVAGFMEELSEHEFDEFCRPFSQYIKHQVDPDNLESLNEKVHETIRANPVRTTSVSAEPMNALERHHALKISYEKRKDRLRRRLALPVLLC
jgi:large subunit ribosomal protein L5e